MDFIRTPEVARQALPVAAPKITPAPTPAAPPPPPPAPVAAKKPTKRVDFEFTDTGDLVGARISEE